MSSIHYGTSLLMLVAAAMAGCAVESADLSDGEMGEDIEMVDSSEAALEQMADGAALVNPHMGAQIAELGAAPVGGSIITPQHGLVHKKGFVPSQTGLISPQKGFVPYQSGLIGSQSGLVASQSGLIGSQSGLVVGGTTQLGVGQYGHCPTKKGPPSKFCPTKKGPPSKFCPSCPSQYPPYPQR